MSDQSHAETALKEIQAIGTDSLSDELVVVHEQAITSIETLLDGLEDTAQAITSIETLLDGLEDTAGSTEPPESADTPDDWEEDEWDEQLDEAREKAELPPTKGTITTKTINGRDYYYLQWREGDKVKSQYVCPVDPT